MCEEKIIPGYDGRYSINEKGEVFRLWYIHNVYKKKYHKRRKLKPHPNKNDVKNPLICVSINSKSVRVINLMVEGFDLHPQMKYKLFPYNADGNVYNNSIENIRFKTLRNETDCFSQDYTSRKCPRCQEFLSLEKFEKIDHKTGQWILLKHCSICNSKAHQEWIKADAIRLAKYKKRRAKYSSSRKGRAKAKRAYQKGKEALSDWYVKGCIRLPDECITPELIQLYRGVFN